MNSNKLSIDWYLEKMIALLKISPLENQFQNFIVYPVLEHIINMNENCKVDIVDCHNFRQDNTKGHDRRKYSVLVKAVPDLLIAKDFFYNNRETMVFNALRAIASVEVKEPNNKWMLDKVVSNSGTDKWEYDNQLYLELLPSLIKNKKLILTNIRRWEIFSVDEVNDKPLEKEILLYVKVLELCGFDFSTDYETVVMEKEGKKSWRKEIKQQVIKDRLEKLNSIPQISDIVKSVRVSDAKQLFEEIVIELDKKYLPRIKEYIMKSHVKTWDIINTPGFLCVNRNDYVETNNNTSVSDIKYSIKIWNELFKELHNFLFPEKSLVVTQPHFTTSLTTKWK